MPPIFKWDETGGFDVTDEVDFLIDQNDSSLNDNDDYYKQFCDPIDVVTVDGEEDIDEPVIRLRLRGNSSDFDSSSKQIFIDFMNNKPITDVNLDYSSVRSFDTSMWSLMQNVEHLSLTGCRLGILPEGMKFMKNLRHLTLRYASLDSIPEWLGDLTNLKSLDISDNRVACLPDEFCKLLNLECLHMNSNYLQALPQRFGDLKMLKYLYISYNQIKELPESFSFLSALRVLELDQNYIRRLSVSLVNLTDLNNLGLSGNCLNSLPQTVGFGRSLERIYLDDNRLEELPKWFDDLPNLITFTAKNNLLKGSSLSLNFLSTSKKLECLNLSDNLIQRLPESLGSIKTLKYFEMISSLQDADKWGGNLQSVIRMQHLPSSFGSLLSDLTQLRLEENDLKALPEKFGAGLTNLVKLNLAKNSLTLLPDTFCKMKNLKECVLSNNCLKKLPQNFGELQSLVNLYLDHNKLNVLPLSFKDCTNLVTLDLFENDLYHFPSLLAKLPRLESLSTEVHISSMAINIEKLLPIEEIYQLHRALSNDCRNTQKNGTKKLYKNANEVFIKKLRLDTPPRERFSFPIGTFDKVISKNMLALHRQINGIDDDPDEHDGWHDTEAHPGYIDVKYVVSSSRDRKRMILELEYADYHHRAHLPGQPPAYTPMSCLRKHYGNPRGNKKKWLRFRTSRVYFRIHNVKEKIKKRSKKRT